MQTLICLLLLCGMVVPSKAAGNPNVVFIISDDQAWTDYGFMGHPEVETPHLDKLSRQSLTFTHGYVPTSLCCPSLAALLTGKFPHETKVTGNEPPRPRDANGKPSSQAYQDPGFLEQVATLNGFITAHPRLPAELAKAGYLSFQSGKWWAGNFSSGGFTHGMSHGSAAKGGRHGDVGLEIGRKTLQPIFDFLAEAQRQQRPFFLWYAPMLPHQPHDPPPRLLEKYQKRTPSLPVAKYWAMCELFDETCGQLLTHLEQQNLADHTLVVFLSDNGWIQDPERPRFRAEHGKPVRVSGDDAGNGRRQDADRANQPDPPICAASQSAHLLEVSQLPQPIVDVVLRAACGARAAGMVGCAAMARGMATAVVPPSWFLGARLEC